MMRVKPALREAQRRVRSMPQLAAIARTRPARGKVRVSYGHASLPRAGEPTGGGIVKFRYLERSFPNATRDFNILYLGSSSLPPDWRELLWLARRRGAPVVWNQNGVAYPGWHGAGWEWVNRPLRRGVREAVHVFFQSEFCKLSSDRYLGEPRGAWEVLYNPVDTARFTPREAPLAGPLTLLLGGTQYQEYRFDRAVRTLALLPDARLIVAGALTWAHDAEARGRALVADLGLDPRVEFAGAYAHDDAPALLRRAHVLLHTKVNDPCPGLVLEAMACGLPVVYSASGGVPELVGEAGVGVETPLDWDRDRPPAPEEFASGVELVAARLEELSAAARERVVERFDVESWVARHRAVFEELAP